MAPECAAAQLALRVRRRAGGFSLIEILVVLVILGVTTAAVTLAIAGAGGERQLAHDGERLRALIGYACEQSERGGRDIGLSLSRAGYQFSASNHSDWLPERDDELRARKWSVAVDVRLTRDGQRVDIGADYPDKPQLVCFASGELTAFHLELANPDSTTRFRIDGAADGTVDQSVADARAR
jgi:general secretion pathway protein H